MKILNAIHAQSIGGVDQVFCNYAEVLVQNGHEVALIISKNGNENYENLGTKKIFKLRNYSQVFDFFQLWWILISFRPDVVFCHSNRLMKWMKILRFFSPAKSVAVNHGISFKNSLHCDFIISINREISDLVVKAGFDASASFVLPNVIKIDQKYREKKIKSPPTFGIYGRIEPRKGFDILINACGILAKNGQDFRLKIGGFEVPGGYCLETIKNFAKAQNIFEKCEFVGTVLDHKKFFEDVDIFFVPSREEPFGLVILEGFLFSTLVISSDSDGGKFLIKDGENGYLFSNEDSSQLAQKIQEILPQENLYNQLTHKAFERLTAEFSFAFLAQEIEKILRIILTNHRT